MIRRHDRKGVTEVGTLLRFLQYLKNNGRGCCSANLYIKLSMSSMTIYKLRDMLQSGGFIDVRYPDGRTHLFNINEKGRKLLCYLEEMTTDGYIDGVKKGLVVKT